EWVSPSMNTTADGSLYLSLIDMVKWDRSLSQRSLLRSSSYDAIWTPARLASGKSTSYGFGWSVKYPNGMLVLEHGGAWQGFRSFIVRFPGSRLTVIVFANSSNSNPQRLAHGVAEIVYPRVKPRLVEGDKNLTEDIRKIFEAIVSGGSDRS